VQGKWVILGITTLAAMALVVSQSRAGRSAYHKWRLSAAREDARTAGAGKPTTGQELLALFSRPRSSEDYTRTWLEHEEALVKLSVLARREFQMAKRVNSDDRYRISEAADREFGLKPLWSVTRSGSNDHAVIVTAPPSDMPRWEALMRRIFEEDQAARSYGSLPTRKTFAW
jgi:hypothetical protein